MNPVGHEATLAIVYEIITSLEGKFKEIQETPPEADRGDTVPSVSLNEPM